MADFALPEDITFEEEEAPVKQEFSLPEDVVFEAPPTEEEKGFTSPKGFFEQLDNPMRLMKTESIPSKFLQWMSTPESEYVEREKKDAVQRVRDLPVLRGLSDKLDWYEDIQVDRDLTPEEEKEFGNERERGNSTKGRISNTLGVSYQIMTNRVDRQTPH